MSAISIRSRPTLSRISYANAAVVQERLFSASASNHVSLQIEKNDPEAVADVVPAYPYGPARWYKQSNRGLYGGQKIQFGNNVGKEFEVKTRRTWHPNVRTKNLFSRALGRPVQVRVTTRTLRTIDKVGGLDEYLLGEKEARIRDLGESGWWLRWAIMQTPVVKKRYAKERKRLGLAELEEAEQLMIASAEETQQAMDFGEEVANDGAFTLDGAASSPPIKFRVGRGAHLILTPKGWRRTRPDMAWVAKSITKHLSATTGYQQLAAAREKIEQMSPEQLLTAQPVGRIARRFRRLRRVLASKDTPSARKGILLHVATSLEKRLRRVKVKRELPLDELKKRLFQRQQSRIQQTIVARGIERVRSIQRRRRLQAQPASRPRGAANALLKQGSTPQKA